MRIHTLLLSTAALALSVTMAAPAPSALAEWEPPKTLASNTRGEALAATPDGTVVAVWATTRPPFEVVARTHAPGGPWGPPTVLGRGYAPVVAVDGQGTVTAAWLTQRRNRTDGVSAARLAAGGGWSAAVHLSDDVPAPGRRPGSDVFGATDLDLAVNGGGDAVLAWAWGRETGRQAWRIQVVERPTGGPWSDPADLSPADGSRTPEAGIDGAGTATIVWGQQLPGDPQALLTRTSDGSGWTATETVAPVGYQPELAVDEAGDAVLLFADRRLAAVAMERPAGGTWGTRTRLSPRGVDLNDAALAGNAAGSVVIAIGRANGRVDVLERPPGGTWSDPERVATPGVPVADVLVALDAGGDAFVGWGEYGLYGAFRPAGGNWGPRATISPDAGVEVLESTHAAMADDGSVAVLWKQEARPLKVRLLAQPGGR